MRGFAASLIEIGRPGPIFGQCQDKPILIGEAKIFKLQKYKRWTNPKEPGQCCYVTSTCLDFAHLFSRDEMKTQMALSLVRDCQYYEANLHAFVIMSHHLHVLVTPQPEETISNLMRNLKRRSANLLAPCLNDFEKSQLSDQSGLNQHAFWKEGFRGNPMVTSEVFRQKANYIHQNPVRAGLTELAELYPWNSAMLYVEGFAIDDYLLDLPKCIQFYEELVSLANEIVRSV